MEMETQEGEFTRYVCARDNRNWSNSRREAMFLAGQSRLTKIHLGLIQAVRYIIILGWYAGNRPPCWGM